MNMNLIIGRLILCQADVILFQKVAMLLSPFSKGGFRGITNLKEYLSPVLSLQRNFRTLLMYSVPMKWQIS